MQLTRLASLALVAIVVAPGCSFYFGGNGDDDDCRGGIPAVLIEHLDPATLLCVQGPYQCLGGGTIEETPLDPSACSSECTGKPELDCLRADGCRAVYTQAEVFDPNAWVNVYGGCFAVGAPGPVRGGTCAGLDAQDCSTHDDCAAVHASVPGDFESCIAEPSVCPPVPTVPVQPRRNPETGRCETVGGGGGGGGCNGAGDPAPPPPPLDWAVCGSPCEALDEASCRMADGCRPILANRFPPNVDAVDFVFAACWPTAPSGPVRGGGCDGLDAQECSRHDDCVARHENDRSACPDPSSCGLVPGDFASCTDETAPPPPPPACTTLGEDACVARADCTPLYAGSDCDCTPAGCTCQTWTFDTCTDH